MALPCNVGVQLHGRISSGLVAAEIVTARASCPAHAPVIHTAMQHPHMMALWPIPSINNLAPDPSFIAVIAILSSYICCRLAAAQLSSACILLWLLAVCLPDFNPAVAAQHPALHPGCHHMPVLSARHHTAASAKHAAKSAL